MTFWNWISLISFLVLPFTAFNLFFNLYPRFKDWRAIRSRKAFDKRLSKLKTRFEKIQEIRKLTVDSAAELLYDFALFLLSITGSFLFFILFCIFFAFPANDLGEYNKYISLTLLSASYCFIVLRTLLATDLFILAKNTSDPFSFAEKAIRFVNNGSRKFSQNPNDLALIHTILDSELFVPGEKTILSRMVKPSNKLNR